MRLNRLTVPKSAFRDSGTSISLDAAFAKARIFADAAAMELESRSINKSSNARTVDSYS